MTREGKQAFELELSARSACARAKEALKKASDKEEKE
jgi:hypothetical protein